MPRLPDDPFAREGTRAGRWLIAAFVLHLALPVAAAIAPEPFWRRMGAAPRPKPTEIDVDVSELPNEHPPEAHEDAAIGDGRSKPDKQDDRARVRHDRAQPARGDDVEPPEPIANGADDSPDSFPAPEPDAHPDPMSRPPSLHEVGGPGEPGAFGLPPGVLPPDSGGGDHGAAPTKTKRRTYDKDAARASIDKGMRSKDAQLGLDFPAAAAIAAVLRDAVRGSTAPDECTGSFGVTVSPAGKVTAISVGSFSGGDAGDWAMAKKAALAQLASRIFEMKSSFAKGAMVGVTIVSKRKMPGGGVGRTGTTFSFDVTDVGAKPIRVVSMSFSARPIE